MTDKAVENIRNPYLHSYRKKRRWSKAPASGSVKPLSDVDLREYYASLKKIRELGAVALPGHDSKVFERGVYF